MYIKYRIFTSNGSWVAPAGVTSVIILGQGGGGGGGAGGGDSASYGGEGGIATFLSPYVRTVTPNTSYSITIGAGGAGAAVGDSFGTRGGISYFSTYPFEGGQGGYSGSFNRGATTTSIGTIVRATGYMPGPSFFSAGQAGPFNYPWGAPGLAPAVTPATLGNYGLYDLNPAPYGISGPSAGGGAPGGSSDAGIGGAGGDGQSGGAATAGGNAPGTSYGAGGGGGGSQIGGGFSSGAGGNGAPGRIIVIWAE